MTLYSVCLIYTLSEFVESRWLSKVSLLSTTPCGYTYVSYQVMLKTNLMRDPVSCLNSGGLSYSSGLNMLVG